LAAASEATGADIAVLTGRRDAGGGLQLVTLAPSPAYARAYCVPGQYVEVVTRGPESRGFFVFAGPAGAPSWELLVRDTGGASEALSNAAVGTTFEVSPPIGTGFPVESARGLALVLVVVGTALAAVRPILTERIARGDARATHVYIGVRSAGDVPLASELDAWAHAGVHLILCLSRPDLDDAAVVPAARRAIGWAQGVLAADIEARRVRTELVFAAGPPAMLDELRALARARSARLRARVGQDTSRGAAGERAQEGKAEGADVDVGAGELEVITNV
jgi:NAD(P)H-flavin reductase